MILQTFVSVVAGTWWRRSWSLGASLDMGCDVDVVMGVWEWVTFVAGLLAGTVTVGAMLLDVNNVRMIVYGYMAMWCCWWTFLILLIANGS